MTFIVGINLSDRLLLASDTKITKKSGDRREIVGYCIKLQQFVDGEFIKENIARLNHIACMFAGNKEFIRFLSAKLSIAFEKKQLPIDINDLIKNIEKYLREIVPKYEGKNKRCRMIFAGTSSDPNVLKTFEFDRLSYLIGPQAGKIEDPNLVEAINIGELDGRGVIFVPDQKIFSFDIDENRSIFELSEVGKTYSIIDGGAHNLTEERKNELLKYFLNKRDIEK